MRSLQQHLEVGQFKDLQEFLEISPTILRSQKLTRCFGDFGPCARNDYSLACVIRIEKVCHHTVPTNRI
jgi:hypothetical protein